MQVEQGMAVEPGGLAHQDGRRTVGLARDLAVVGAGQQALEDGRLQRGALEVVGRQTGSCLSSVATVGHHCNDAPEDSTLWGVVHCIASDLLADSVA
mgnify:CR=1 FL=1